MKIDKQHVMALFSYNLWTEKSKLASLAWLACVSWHKNISGLFDTWFSSPN